MTSLIREHRTASGNPGHLRLNLNPSTRSLERTAARRSLARQLAILAAVVHVALVAAAARASDKEASGREVTGTLTGALLPTEDATAPLPETLEATPFRPGTGEAAATVTCPAAERRWSCELPVGTWDLRLTSAGFAPLFLRGVELTAGTVHEVGAFRLAPGTTLEGWVVTEGRGRDVVVHAQRVGSGHYTRKEDRGQSALTAWSAPADERGRFRLASLPPGRYEIHAESGDLRSVTVDHRIEEAGARHELPAPLALEPATELRLTVEPPLDPWDEPWKVVVLAPTADPTVLKQAAEGTVGDDGTWREASLTRGRYNLQILDSQGGNWHLEELPLGGDVEERFVALDVVPVRGTLDLPEWSDPAAKVRFWSHRGPIDMSADEDRSFTGSLPDEGEYRVEILTEHAKLELDPVEVRRRPGKSFATVDLALPHTLLTGTVTKNGQPVEALLLALDGELDPRAAYGTQSIAAQAESDADGRYRIAGVLPGRLRLRATDGSATSPWVTIDLREDQEVERDLTLETPRELAGRTMMDGQPLAGVKVLAQAPDDLATQAVSSLDGSFTLRLRPTSRELDLLLVPPMGALTFRRLPLPDGEEAASVVELVIARAAGDLVIGDLQSPLFLFHDGVGHPLEQLLGLLYPSRITADPDRGLIVSGLEAGAWWLCREYRLDAERCTEALVLPGGETQVEPPERIADRADGPATGSP